MNTSNSKIIIEIENNNPITLNQLTLSLLNVHNQYTSFLAKEGHECPKESAILYVKELKTGSCIIELVPAFVPLLTELDTIFGYTKYLKFTFDFFLGKEEKPAYDYSKKDCLEIQEIVKQTATDKGSNMNFKVEGDNHLHLHVSHVEANAIQNNCDKYIEELEEEKSEYYKKMMFYWAKADFIKNREVFDDRGIIENIDAKPKKVVFINDETKTYMMSHNQKIGKPWQHLAYFVDVEVNKIKGVVKAYKITHVYANDTFDPYEG